MHIMDKYSSFYVLCLFMAAITNAFPQDAELLPSGIPRTHNEKTRGSGITPSDDGDFVVVRLRPVTSSSDFFRRLFGDFSFPTFESFFPRELSFLRFDDPVFPDFSDISRNIPNFSSLPSVPDFASLPDNYDNSTHEVKVVDGNRVEVKQSTRKSKGDHGVVFSHVQVFRSLPDGNRGEGPSSIPNQGTPARGGSVNPARENNFPNFGMPEVEIPRSVNDVRGPETENIGVQDTKLQVRKRRSVIIGNLIYQIIKMLLGSKNQTISNNERGERYSLNDNSSSSLSKLIFGIKPVSKTLKPALVSMFNDTRVNYIQPVGHMNTDAEVFDMDRLKNEKGKEVKPLKNRFDRFRVEQLHADVTDTKTHKVIPPNYPNSESQKRKLVSNYAPVFRPGTDGSGSRNKQFENSTRNKNLEVDIENNFIS